MGGGFLPQNGGQIAKFSNTQHGIIEKSSGGSMIKNKKKLDDVFSTFKLINFQKIRKNDKSQK